MKRSILLLLMSMMGITCINAQNTLNIHRKTGDVVSFNFSEKPVVTYTEDGLHIATLNVDVDYPFNDLQKFTFSTTMDAIESVEASVNADDGLTRIYSLDGKLIKTVETVNGVASFSVTDLPRGIYIVKNNTTTYKITKR